ncbi:MAG TPA: hypothetical protein VE032_09380 [Actinomycetota bacterium]|nr:hypothetical protein [Actinomycetota bacterium]
MRRVWVGALALAAILAACTGDPTTSTAPAPTSTAPTPTGAPAGRISHERTSAPSFTEAVRAICEAPDVPPSEPVDPDPLPPDIRSLVRQVERTRGLTFPDPVTAAGISDDVMDRKIRENFEIYALEEPLARRTAAWRTLGVIPPDADLRTALEAFITGQVVGFYDPATGELVYLDEGAGLTPTAEITLAHELTHALEDQRFDLARLDAIAARCRDEAYEAALGLVEGSATYHGVLAAIGTGQDIDFGLLADAQLEALASPPDGVPPFVYELESWPYIDGPVFVQSIVQRGDERAVDDALGALPATTEQIIHPEGYPSELPRDLDIPDLTPAIGPGWGDLDAMVVGEEWLRAMLALRLDRAAAAEAAAGWDGGIYRAWSDGADVIVVMETAWDTPEDADAFAGALETWVGDETNTSIVRIGEDQVTFVRATDPDLVIDTDNDDAEGA